MKPSRYAPGLRQIAPPPGKRAGQMASTAMTDADTTLNQTGDGLNRVVARIASGRGRMMKASGGKVSMLAKRLGPLEKRRAQKALNAKKAKQKVDDETLHDDPDDEGISSEVKRMKKAEGGKVSSGISALRHLAKKFEAALESGDTALAKRIQREIQLTKREVTPADLGESAARRENAVREGKLATFSEGGKVSRFASIIKQLGSGKRLHNSPKSVGYALSDQGYTSKDVDEFISKHTSGDSYRKVVRESYQEAGDRSED